MTVLIGGKIIVWDSGLTVSVSVKSRFLNLDIESRRTKIFPRYL